MQGPAAIPGLPGSYRHEVAGLCASGVNILVAMGDSQLNALCGKGFVTIARPRRLRGQAGLIPATSLPPEAAALLLHAGISSMPGAWRSALPRRL